MYRCIPRYIPAITGVPVAALQPCCSVRHSGAMFDMSSTLPLSNRQFSVDVLPYLLFPSQCFRKTVFLFMTNGSTTGGHSQPFITSSFSLHIPVLIPLPDTSHSCNAYRIHHHESVDKPENDKRNPMPHPVKAPVGWQNTQ